jgi:hypothetical protein
MEMKTLESQTRAQQLFPKGGWWFCEWHKKAARMDILILFHPLRSWFKSLLAQTLENVLSVSAYLYSKTWLIQNFAKFSLNFAPRRKIHTNVSGYFQNHYNLNEKSVV